MSYTATEWQNGVTPLNADNLNHLETQYAMAMADKRCVPSGLITMWSGLLSSIPDGRLLCDGNNGTLNTIGLFIKSIPNDSTNPGETGGNISATSSGHTHTNPNTNSAGSHNHAPYTAYVVDYGFEKYYITSIPTADAHTHTQGNTGSATMTISDVSPPYIEMAFIIAT